MLNIKLNTANERKGCIVEPTMTPAELLQREEVVLEGANISLDGIPLHYQELTSSFEDLGVEESATLSVVIKAENA